MKWLQISKNSSRKIICITHVQHWGIFAVEIPLFHVLTARITFENIYGSITPVEGVSSTPADADGSVPAGFKVDKSVFDIPSDYEQGAAWWRDDLNGDLEESELDLVELQAELEHIP